MLNRYFYNHILLQMFGAYNDSFLRIGMMTLLVQVFQYESLIPLAGLCLMLPMALLGYWCGCVATKYNMSRIIIWIKILEFLSIFLFNIAYYFAYADSNLSLILGFLSVFVAGLHAAFYSPIKFSILHYMFKGNVENINYGASLVEGTTFAGILFGSIIGSIVMQHSYILIGISYAFAIFGIITAMTYPPYGEQNKATKLKFYDKEVISHIPRSTFKYIYHICWFWLFVTMFQNPMISIIKFVFNAEQYVYTMTTFISSLGLMVGSFLLIVFLQRQYNKAQSIAVLVITLVLSIFFTINIYYSEITPPPVSPILIENIYHHQNIIEFVVVAFLIAATLSIYVTPLYGDTITSVEQKSYLNRVLGLSASITSLPILIAFVLHGILLALFSYTVIYTLLTILIVVEIYIQYRS